MSDLNGAKNSRYRVVNGKPIIELKLKSPHQLFDERDPAPFRERDLEDDAAHYIVSSYLELPRKHTAQLSLYFATLMEFDRNPQMIRDAIHTYFQYERDKKYHALRTTFRQGFISLCIGLVFLLLCTSFSHHFASVGTDFLPSLVKEGLFIMGWVAMWRPIHIFLYDWWPIHADLVTYRNLSQIDIEVYCSDLAVVRNQDSAKSALQTLALKHS